MVHKNLNRRQPIRLLNEIYNYGKDNLALIHVMIQSPYVTMIERDVSMTFTEYVANTGRDLFKPTFLSNQKHFVKVSSSAINVSIMNF